MQRQCNGESFALSRNICKNQMVHMQKNPPQKIKIQFNSKKINFNS